MRWTPAAITLVLAGCLQTTPGPTEDRVPSAAPSPMSLEPANFQTYELASTNVSFGESRSETSPPAEVRLPSNISFLHLALTYSMPSGLHPQNIGQPAGHGATFRDPERRILWSHQILSQTISSPGGVYHREEKVLRGNFADMALLVSPQGWSHRADIHIIVSRAEPIRESDATVPGGR